MLLLFKPTTSMPKMLKLTLLPSHHLVLLAEKPLKQHFVK